TYSGVNRLEDRWPTRTVPPSLPPSAGSSPVTALPQAARAGVVAPAASRPSRERRRIRVVVMGFSSRTVRGGAAERVVRVVGAQGCANRDPRAERARCALSGGARAG